jgi:hypothetical protein
MREERDSGLLSWAGWAKLARISTVTHQHEYKADDMNKASSMIP